MASIESSETQLLIAKDPGNNATQSKDNGTQSEKDNATQSKSATQPNLHTIQIGSFHIPLFVFNASLAVISIALNVVLTISLPMYAESMEKVGSDTYIAVLVLGFWFPWPYFLVLVFVRVFVDKTSRLTPLSSRLTVATLGAAWSLNAIVISYASLPSRTPPYLQAILPTLHIPLTVIGRLVILRKGISKSQVVCCGVILIGIFISMEPTIFNIQVAPPSSVVELSGHQGEAYWPFLYCLGTVLSALVRIFFERAFMKIYPEEEQKTALMAWVQVANYGFIILLFWTNFIPGFGMASSAQDFIDKLARGFLCNYGGDPTCPEVPGRAWLFLVSYTLANFSNVLLIRFSDGAVYSTVVTSLVMPISAIFWSFFKLDPYFHWQPEFNITTVFVIGGIVIITPAVFMYSYFGSLRVHAEDVDINQDKLDISETFEKKVLKSHNLSKDENNQDQCEVPL